MMSYNMRMPGAWESDEGEPSATSDDFVHSHIREPSPHPPPPQPPRRLRIPSPTTGHGLPTTQPSMNHQRRNISSPTAAQGRRIPRPTTQPPRAPFRKTTKRAPEFEFFGDSSDEGNGITTQNPKKPLVIAVFGKTGTGKSTFIRTVTGKDINVGHSLTSCTKDVLPVSCRIDDENVILVDTPGFGDTNVTDTEILKRIAEWMKDSYDDGFLLSGIIYLHRISDGRMEGTSLKNLRMMRKLCGDNSLKNVVLATTMWETITGNVGLERELELQQVFWKDIIDDGATTTRILTEKGDDAHQLVRSLLKNKPLSTKLQEELHSGKSLVQTEAGAEIREELAKQEDKLRKEFEAELADLKAAMKSRNQKTVEEAKQEMKSFENEIEKLKAQTAELQELTLKPLPKAKRNGLFGTGRYHCLYSNCRRKTNQVALWTCKECGNRQRNIW